MIFGAIAGFVGDAIDSAADFVEDVVDSVGDAAVALGEAAVDVAGSAGGYLGDGLGYAGSFVNAATGGLAEEAFGLIDDTVFDGLDYITGGVVDLDFDDGQFGVNLGIGGLAQVGVGLGEDGVTATLDAGLANVDLGLTDDGLSLSTEAGIDFGPLPYANGHIEVGANGDVAIAGHVQGTVPLPGGILSGHASGGFVRTDQGWGAYVEGDGTFTLPSGTTIAGGLAAGYMEDADGSRTTFGIEGSVSSPGMGSVGGSYGYQRIEEDGTVVTHHEASAHAEGFGIKASAEADYLNIETGQGSFSQWTTDVDIDGLDADSLAQLGATLLGADPDEVTAFLGQASEQGELGDLLGQLDPATTAALLERLVAQPAGGGPATPGLPGLDPLGDPTAASTGGDSGHLDGDPLGMDHDAIDPIGSTAADELDDPFATADDDLLDPADPIDPVDPLGGDLAAAEPVGVDAPPEPEPVDFDTTIAAADQVEDDFDTMFDDIG